jgi:DNA polymerase zeta
MFHIVSPTGLMFVKPSVRKSLLAKMLTEILDTRVMVKRAMGEENKNKGLYRLLDARQLGLKFLANVTYGYTSATFSGRMPAVEIADSIVQTGRETLERAIDVINTTKKWGARVVYGDTDSVFVYLPGRSRDEAFTIGNDIADTITRLNPVPVKLKFEKVSWKEIITAIVTRTQINDQSLKNKGLSAVCTGNKKTIRWIQV